jgi:glycosyltransferase involved in cell wall biosynthesis
MNGPIDVLVDARIIERGHTGMARYLAGIAANLPSSIRLTAMLSSPSAKLDGATDTLRVRTPFLAQQEQFELPLRVAQWRGLSRRRGVFWVPAYNAACLAPGPMVVTVHDANHLAFPEHNSLFHKAYYRSVVRLACERAKAVITDSDFSRRELVERIGVPEEKIRVIHLAADARERPSEETIAAARAKYGLPSRYVSYLGNFKPHKNLSTLLRASPAFARDVPLVLIGGTESELEPALSDARRQGSNVHVLRGVPDSELWPIIAGSSVFAFPSLYEGYGLPPLEAMALGVPVVVSNAASLPEVVGDAALQVPPRDETALGQAISRLLEDRSLAQTLSERGRQRARSRTWQDVALQTARVLWDASEA